MTVDTDKEWRIISDFPNYEVSEFGDVRRVVPPITGRWRKGFLAAKPYSPLGHMQISLRRGKVRKFPTLHSLVAAAFIGPRPGGAWIRHLDGNPKNNHYSNLAYGSAKENFDDRKAHGTHPTGMMNGRAVLSLENALEIVARRKAGESLKSLASVFGVGMSTISRVSNGDHWTATKGV